MITFKQFIAEDEDFDDELMQLIKKDCGPFLEKSRNRGLIFRGVRGLTQDNVAGTVFDPIDEGEIKYWKKQVHKDRKPKDINVGIHKEIDQWFDKEFGIKARSQSMFCLGQNGRKVSLNQYGEVCVVFPIGDFKYVWSPRIKDLYNEVNDDWDADEESEVAALRYMLETGAYTDKEFDAAVKGASEIMIVCDSYYAFPLKAEDSIRAALNIY